MQGEYGEYMSVFLDESGEHLTNMEAGLLTLEENPGDLDNLNAIFRAAHSIKGNSSFLGLDDITHFTHAMENLLDEMRSGTIQATPPRIGLLLQSKDTLVELINALKDGKPRPATYDGLIVALKESLEAAKGAATETVVEATPVADSAAAEMPTHPQAAEAPVAAPAVAAVEKHHEDAPQVVREAKTTGDSSSIRVSVEKVDALIDLVGELSIAQAMVNQLIGQLSTSHMPNLEEALIAMQQCTRELQERVMGVRMIPVGTIFRRFPRLIRDLAGTLGKQVRAEIIGDDTELDKQVIERLSDPLTHLVRNAVDHGIELPEERRNKGKTEEAFVRLAAFYEGGNVIVDVEEDGRGLDTERIRQKAITLGLITAQDVLTTEQIQSLIFRPGFSTAAAVTDISGRGVGMDVVKRNIEALNGSIEIQSRAGHGTRFRIRLPLTLAILDGLSVSVGDEVYILPLLSVVQSFRPKPADVHRVMGRGEIINVHGQSLPLLRLHQLFCVTPRITDACQGLVIVLEQQGKRFGLLVDDLLGQQQVVMKSLEENYSKVDGLSGATILGDGRVALIIDIPGLARLTGTSSPLSPTRIPGEAA
jgi:two-component system chemotaxis sensor kinase CheA